MAAQDYITTVEATNAIAPLLAAQTVELAAAITQASRLIDRTLDRGIASQSYDEVHDPGRTRAIRLRQYPVSRVSRIACGTAPYLVIAFADATASRATAEQTFAGDPPYSQASLTGLRLDATRSGVTTTATLPFATYPTLATLQAAINAVAGFTATIATGQSLYATADMILSPGAKNVIGSAATLWAYSTDISDYDLDVNTGRITLGGGWPLATPTVSGWATDSFRYPDRPWGADKRFVGVRVSYTAGYLSVPDDLKRACISVIQAIFANEQIAGIFKSEKAGTDSYELLADNRLLGPVMSTLAPYRRRSLA